MNATMLDMSRQLITDRISHAEGFSIFFTILNPQDDA
jgi:hypothetical protein